VNVLTKQRTREHIIADLSVNFAERIFLLAGFVIDRVVFDYGYDLIVRTFNAEGHLEPGAILVQMKASDAPEYSINQDFLTLRVDMRDDAAWRQEYAPVLLVLYDAGKDTAFFLHYQAQPRTSRSSVRVPTTNTLTVEAVRQMREVKNTIVQGLSGL
jgi:hypothetical protein